MKRALITLILMAFLVLSALTASAENFNANLGGGLDSSWTIQAGSFATTSDSNGGGIVSTASTSTLSRALHPITLDSSGNFTCDIKFKVNDLTSIVFIGLAHSTSDSKLLIGYNGNSAGFVAAQGSKTLTTSAPSASAVYIARISYSGNTYHYAILDSNGNTLGSADVSNIQYPLPQSPAYIDLRIQNKSTKSGPIIYSVSFESPITAATPTATPSPGANATGQISTGIDHSDMQNWYATQYVPPVLSNQSVVYDQGGHIVKVITGKPGAATTMPISGATVTPTAIPTVVPSSNATAPLNVTKNNTPTITPVSTVAPTKSQSPGFGIILVAIGLLAAIYFVSRKK